MARISKPAALALHFEESRWTVTCVVNRLIEQGKVSTKADAYRLLSDEYGFLDSQKSEGGTLESHLKEARAGRRAIEPALIERLAREFDVPPLPWGDVMAAEAADEELSEAMWSKLRQANLLVREALSAAYNVPQPHLRTYLAENILQTGSLLGDQNPGSRE